MKIRGRITLLGVLAVTAAVMAVTAITDIEVKGDNEKSPQDINIASFETEDAEYYLRDCEGYIAVFHGSSTRNPVKVTDIETVTLNDVDRELLRTGIPAADKTELLSLLEDFSS